MKGGVTIVFRAVETVYQIKSTAIDSLGVELGPDGALLHAAHFVAKANLQDVTDPENSVSIDGGLTLQRTLIDNGEPGAEDRIGITLWGKNGELVLSTNWNVATLEQLPAGGNLVVR